MCQAGTLGCFQFCMWHAGKWPDFQFCMWHAGTWPDFFWSPQIRETEEGRFVLDSNFLMVLTALSRVSVHMDAALVQLSFPPDELAGDLQYLSAQCQVWRKRLVGTPQSPPVMWWVNSFYCLTTYSPFPDYFTPDGNFQREWCSLLFQTPSLRYALLPPWTESNTLSYYDARFPAVENTVCSLWANFC